MKRAIVVSGVFDQNAQKLPIAARCDNPETTGPVETLNKRRELLRTSRNNLAVKPSGVGLQIQIFGFSIGAVRATDFPRREMQAEAADPASRPSAVALGVAFLWRLVCIPVYAVLAVFRPLIGVVLAAVGVLGVLVALFFRFLDPLPHFSFWTVLVISVGSLVMIGVYDFVLELFRPP